MEEEKFGTRFSFSKQVPTCVLNNAEPRYFIKKRHEKGDIFTEPMASWLGLDSGSMDSYCFILTKMLKLNLRGKKGSQFQRNLEGHVISSANRIKLFQCHSILCIIKILKFNDCGRSI